MKYRDVPVFGARRDRNLRAWAVVETLALAAVLAAAFVFFAVLTLAGGRP